MADTERIEDARAGAIAEGRERVGVRVIKGAAKGTRARCACNDCVRGACMKGARADVGEWGQLQGETRQARSQMARVSQPRRAPSNPGTARSLVPALPCPRRKGAIPASLLHCLCTLPSLRCAFNEPVGTPSLVYRFWCDWPSSAI